MPFRTIIKRLNPKLQGDKARQQQTYLPLYQLQQRHRLVDIKVGHNETPFQSMILDVNVDDRIIIIDELFPKVPKPHQLPGQLVQVRGKDAGAIIRFQSVILKDQNTDLLTSHQLKLPKTVTKNQRRNAYRIDIDHRQKTTISLKTTNDIQLKGNLIDLSASGARIGFSEPLPPEVRRGVILPFCKLRVENHLDLECVFDIRNLTTSESNEHNNYIGGVFMFMPPKEGRALNRFISKTDRERRKQQIVAA